MCKLCDDNNIGPDLGHGGFIQADLEATWVSVDPKNGIRITQKRKNTYAGPDGTEEREETESVYIGWNDLQEVTLTMIAADLMHNHTGEENDDQGN